MTQSWESTIEVPKLLKLLWSKKRELRALQTEVEDIEALMRRLQKVK
jgi:hypothetical protein